jgi:hypothetical protein
MLLKISKRSCGIYQVSEGDVAIYVKMPFCGGREIEQCREEVPRCCRNPLSEVL